MRASFCLFLLLTIFLGAGDAQETLLPVEVTATRLRDVQELEAQVPGKVIVITEEDIQKLGAKTIQEVLQYQTGVVF